MAQKNIQMNKRNAAGTGWDDLYPISKAENVLDTLSLYRLNKDSEGIFTRLEYRRPDGTLGVLIVLSGGTTPKYTTRTLTYYESDGTTVLYSVSKALTYDADGMLTSEV